MILTNTSHIDGREVSSYLGIVSAEVIVGAHVFKDIFAGMRDFFGGRSGSYEKTLQDAKEMALRDLEAKGREMGADAILAVDLDYEVLGQKGSMLMVSVNGTAVKLK